MLEASWQDRSEAVFGAGSPRSWVTELTFGMHLPIRIMMEAKPHFSYSKVLQTLES